MKKVTLSYLNKRLPGVFASMEFVTFRENPAPVGVRVVEGWALSDSPLSAKGQ